MKAWLDAISNALFRARVRFLEWLGWGYWAYYPDTDKLIWTRKECEIYGVPCEHRVKIGTYAMFSSVLINDDFREFSSHVVEMSRKSGRDFRQQFIARNQTTQEIIFIEARGKWVFSKDGHPICLHGFNRKMEPLCFQSKFDQLNMRRIISEWRREGAIPAEFLNATYGSPRE